LRGTSYHGLSSNTHPSPGNPQAAAEKAQGIVAEEIERPGWPEDTLRGHRKGHRIKVKIALRLREETTMTSQWIADRLKMGTWTHLANRLYHPKNQVCVNTQD
jgi:hypothetical protein